VTAVKMMTRMSFWWTWPKRMRLWKHLLERNRYKWLKIRIPA